jgi:hypothetical protein
MDISTRQSLHILLFVIGLVLIVGGITAGKPGAAIVGLIVAAVNLQQWERQRSSQAEQQ